MTFSTRHLSPFAWIFLVTGFLISAFALLFMSKTFLFSYSSISQMVHPAVLLILVGPLSFVSGFSLFKRYHRGVILGLVTSGIFIFYSVSIFFNNSSGNSKESVLNITPAIFGMLIAFAFIYRVMKNIRYI